MPVTFLPGPDGDHHDVGDEATVTAVFTDDNGTLTDPTSLEVVVLAPDGTATTYLYGTDAALTKLAVGTYRVAITFSAAGEWRYQWVATGALTDTESGVLEVFADTITNPKTAAAVEELRSMVAASEAPTLDDPEIARLLRRAQRPDSTGLMPSDVGWVPTYNLDAAAAEGWRWKAGKASPNYSFGVDAARSEQSDVFKHCQAMIAQYEKGESGSSRVSGLIDDDALMYLDTRAYGPLEFI